MGRFGNWWLRLLATGIVYIGLRWFDKSLFSLAAQGFVPHAQEQFLKNSGLWMAVTIGLAYFLGLLKIPTGKECKHLLKWSFLGELLLLSSFALGFWFFIRSGLTLPANQLALQTMLQTIPLPLMAIKILLYAPIMEEILCRGLMPRLFEGAEPLGHLVSMIVFAALHQPENLFAWIVYGGMGALFSLVAWRGRSLWASMLCHSLHNALVLCVMLYGHLPL